MMCRSPEQTREDCCQCCEPIREEFDSVDQCSLGMFWNAMEPFSMTATTNFHRIRGFTSTSLIEAFLRPVGSTDCDTHRGNHSFR